MAVGCSLFVVCCALFVVCCLSCFVSSFLVLGYCPLFVVTSVLFAVGWLLACWLLLGVRRLRLFDCCLLFVVLCLMLGVCCLLVVVCWLADVVCWFLFFPIVDCCLFVICCCLLPVGVECWVLGVGC